MHTTINPLTFNLGALICSYLSFLLSLVTKLWTDLMTHEPRHLRLIKALHSQHAVAQTLQEMITNDGAGSWPPRGSYRESWPPELQPFHDIFFELAHLVPVLDPSLVQAVNEARRNEYRKRLQMMLKERVDIEALKATLSDATGEETCVTNEAYNGFYACISALRHAYRFVESFSPSNFGTHR